LRKISENGQKSKKEKHYTRGAGEGGKERDGSKMFYFIAVARARPKREGLERR
jgi:hypothetical protein